MSNYSVTLDQIVLGWLVTHIEKKLPNYLTYTDVESIAKIVQLLKSVADNNTITSSIGYSHYYFSIQDVELVYIPKICTIMFNKPTETVDLRKPVEVPEPQCFMDATEHLNFPNPNAWFRGMTFEKSLQMSDPTDVPEPPPPPIKPELQISEEDYDRPLRRPELKVPEPPLGPIGKKPKGPIESQPQKSTFFSRLGWLFFGE
jgi:hypothetical protein